MDQGGLKKRVILADDHAILRQGIRSLVESESPYAVVAEVSDGEELMVKLAATPCDLVILDISMPKLNGLFALEKIKADYPKIKVLILSMHKDRDHIKQAMFKGADGYLLKDAAFEKLISSLNEIFSGHKAFGSEAMTVILDEYAHVHRSQTTLDSLTRREREILRELVKGRTNREIADELDISARTVEGHRANLMTKLGVKNMAELMRAAMALGIE